MHQSILILSQIKVIQQQKTHKDHAKRYKKNQKQNKKKII